MPTDRKSYLPGKRVNQGAGRPTPTRGISAKNIRPMRPAAGQRTNPRRRGRY